MNFSDLSFSRVTYKRPDSQFVAHRLDLYGHLNLHPNFLLKHPGKHEIKYHVQAAPKCFRAAFFWKDSVITHWSRNCRARHARKSR